MPHYQKFYVYFMTNRNRTVLYLGFTGDLKSRVKEHENGVKSGFSKQYHCHYLIYFELYKYVFDAIKREKEIKNWRREKKLALIATSNPQWLFLNEIAQEL